ncbi:Brp/Blh family beta-carotene 15,15'-dioxygenase [Halorientalis regularis]|uniref:Probable beta-carotene 15,15'-dioxygenase n=1 Tax=Halorientalis regularis TaxID=660518 RepID=A0A1G7LV04_9EURY|nr:Brp/Blh family beta-carotene 15,15'-dioxygenase [Halorientalis regularis]SDF52779.1 beta-carotene 15,15'-monooxygenase, Brp/Blh family [Halorientalis regularis]
MFGVVERRLPTEDDGAAGRLLVASWALFAGLTVLFGAATVSGRTVPIRLQAIAYLALMLGVSLPHGGFEHVANLRGRGESVRARYLLAYLLLIGASLAVFVLAPVAGLALAVAITCLKGGFGGLHVLESTTGGDHLRSRPQRVLGALVRGGAVMVVPMVSHPGVFYMVSDYMVSLFEPGAMAGAIWVFESPARDVLWGVYLLALLAHLGWGYLRADGPGSWLPEAGETLLLVAFFAVVPPILAVGVYFPCWYATRQTARLSADGRSLRAVLARVARGAVAPWLGALVLLAGLAVALPSAPTTPTGWVALYSVFVAVIAVPHVLVGSWLDRQRGIWTT